MLKQMEKDRLFNLTTKVASPANFIHDGSDEVVSLFPESNGGAFPKKSNVATGRHYEGGWGNVNNEVRTEMRQFSRTILLLRQGKQS